MKKQFLKTATVVLTLSVFTALVYSSCRQESKKPLSETSNTASVLNVTNGYLPLGCINPDASSYQLKYNEQVTNNIVALILNDGSIVSNSHILSKVDTGTGVAFYTLVCSVNKGNENFSMGFDLQVEGDILALTPKGCIYTCIPTYHCNCELDIVVSCLVLRCGKICNTKPDGTVEEGGCVSKITKVGEGIVIGPDVIQYISNQIPEC
jgi:hypothetical protein